MSSSAAAASSVFVGAGRKSLALVAHDALKAEMVDFAGKHAARLARCRLLATGTTGSRVAAATGLTVECLLSGPLGGDAQIGALVSTGQVAGLFFFTDPLTAHPHEPDVLGLLRLCNVHGVPVATNRATAELIVGALATAAAGDAADAAAATAAAESSS